MMDGPPGPGRVLGRSVPRLEDPPLLTGRGQFVPADLISAAECPDEPACVEIVWRAWARPVLNGGSM